MSNQALEAFKFTKPSDELLKAMQLKTTASGTRTVGLLPSTSKTGPSLTELCGLGGQALKAWKRRQSDAMKVAFGKEQVEILNSKEFTARKMSISKTGVLGFIYEPTGDVPEKALKDMTKAEKIEMLKTKEAERAEILASMSDDDVVSSINKDKAVPQDVKPESTDIPVQAEEVQTEVK